MKLSHFDAVRPLCPGCRTEAAAHPLRVTTVLRERPGEIDEGVLGCPNPACLREFPVIDGLPVLVPNVRGYLADHLPAILSRADLSETMESLIGDAAGPGSVHDATRQHLSTYGWGHWADLDPAESPRADSGLVGMLDRGLALAGPPAEGVVLDLGCAAGRTTFELARRLDRPVLGVDLHFAMLRLARRVLVDGVVSYPRRRVGMVYDRRTFPAAQDGARHVDFWVCDALALPFAPGIVGFVNSLNVLDCLASPYEHLQRLARLLAPGAAAVIATPYDWSSGVTAVEGWLGGHSQRSPDHGQSDVFLRRLLDGSHPSPITGLRLAGEVAGLPWSVRLHDRAVMQYQSHLVVARRTADAAPATPDGGAG